MSLLSYGDKRKISREDTYELPQPICKIIYCMHTRRGVLIEQYAYQKSFLYLGLNGMQYPFSSSGLSLEQLATVVLPVKEEGKDCPEFLTCPDGNKFLQI